MEAAPAPVHPTHDAAAAPEEDPVEEGEGEEGEEECEEEEHEEEGEGDSSEEEDRREFGIYQCLPVDDGEPDWGAGEEAQTVEEYLRRVRYEARHLPDVVTAELPSQHTAADAPHAQGGGGAGWGSIERYLAADPGVPPCDPRLKPSAGWTLDFLRQFAQLRRRLQREYELTSGQAAAGGVPLGGGLRILPQLAGGGAWDAELAAEMEALELDPPSALTPELQQLRGLDQLQVRRQLHAAIRQAVRDERLGPEAAAQLYALSARIEKPLHAGTAALYRQLLRLAAGQRAALGDPADPLLPHLNIAIIVAGAFFGQDEELSTMWEEDEE